MATLRGSEMTKLELACCELLVKSAAPRVIAKFNKDNNVNVVRAFTAKEVDKLAFEAAVQVLPDYRISDSDCSGSFSEVFYDLLQEVWDDSDDSDSPWAVAELEQRMNDGDAELNDCNRFNYGP
jgi:hypothetical protein